MSPDKVSVTITGGTESKRSELAAAVNLTRNGLYILKPRTPADYVVCNDPKSSKAIGYVTKGSQLITEAQLREYLEADEFPAPAVQVIRPERKPTLEITWTAWNRPPLPCTIEYAGLDGERFTFTVLVERRGVGDNDHEYLGVSDHGTFKTLRCDRILKANYL